MAQLTLGAILVVALLTGFVTGWLVGKARRLAMPNVLAATLVLTAGSLGGPLLTYALLGRGTLSYAVALLVAGCSAGITFWPMGETQGQRQWL